MAILTSKGARAPHQLKGRRNVRISRDRRGSGDEFDKIEEMIGDLTLLETSEKTNLVGSINEVVDNVNEVAKITFWSTEEKVIGKWIDGKPIYRRILDYSTTPTPVSLDVTSWNIDTPISIKGSLGNQQDKSGFVHMLPYNDGQTMSMLYFRNYCKVLEFIGTSNRYGYVILEYTKTTD